MKPGLVTRFAGSQFRAIFAIYTLVLRAVFCSLYLTRQEYFNRQVE